MTAPYYQDDTVTLWLGDWREILPSDARASLIVADPPYGETSLAWDRWPRGWPSLAAGHAASMWAFGSMRMFLRRQGEFMDWRMSQDVVWEKHNGSGFANDRFRRVHEHAVHWYRGRWSDVYHVTPTTPDATPRVMRKKAKPAQWQGATGPSVYVSEDGGPRLARSVQFHRSLHRQAINETEKPVPLLEPLISYACPPGGLVLDLFSGSASALVAVRNLGEGRRGVGFEVREEQCEKAALRLARAAEEAAA